MSAQAAQAANKALGDIVQGFGSFQASRARAAALKKAAKMARGEASQEAQIAVGEMERAGARAAVVGAAGGGGFAGSFASVLEDLERTGTFNARSAIYAGNVEANNLNYEAKVAKAEGNLALITSFMQAGGTLASERMQGAERRKQEAAKQKLYVAGYGR